MADELEAPGTDAEPDWAGIYRSRGDEVVEHRPVFTGDVFSNVQLVGEPETITVIILQHPCAIRLDGVRLADKLLVAQVMPSRILLPSQWSGKFYKQMPLAELLPGGPQEHHTAMFNKHQLVTPAELEEGTRIACLSQKGVNLLLQRWVHHNSRAVIHSSLYQEVSSPQYEEADIVEDWCTDRLDDGIDVSKATTEIDEWLSDAEKTGVSPRELLKEDQHRSRVRQAVRKHRKNLISQ